MSADYEPRLRDQVLFNTRENKNITGHVIATGLRSGLVAVQAGDLVVYRNLKHIKPVGTPEETKEVGIES